MPVDMLSSVTQCSEDREEVGTEGQFLSFLLFFWSGHISDAEKGLKTVMLMQNTQKNICTVPKDHNLSQIKVYRQIK